MSALIAPFRGFLPAPGVAHRIVGPPRALLSEQQLAEMGRDELSFRHSAGRSAGVSHATALAWLQELRAADALEEAGPAVFVYRVTHDELAATGIIAEVSLAAYDDGTVKPHEATLDKSETKMAHYMRRTRVYGNPVALAHRPHAEVSAAIAERTGCDPDLRFGTIDGSTHEMWEIGGQAATGLCESFDEHLYVVDGHHRLAAASRVASEEGLADARVPAGIFSTDELRLRSFARCVIDPDVDRDAVLERLGSDHHLRPADGDDPRPHARLEFGVRVGDAGYVLRLELDDVPSDPLAALDVNLLQEHVLGPVLGITDPRRDRRLRFVADLPGDRLARDEFSISFLPFPVSVDDVLAAADLGRTMPPKSTWFAPKLPSGLVFRLRDRS